MENSTEYTRRIERLIDSGVTTMDVLDAAKGWSIEDPKSNFVILTALRKTQNFSVRQLHDIKAWFMDIISRNEVMGSLGEISDPNDEPF